MKWTITAADYDDNGNEFKLQGARSRKFTARLRAPSTAQFTVNGEHKDSLQLIELQADIQISCQHPLINSNGMQLCFRGRTGPTQDTISETSHTVAFQFSDYRAVLDRKLYEFDTFSGAIDIGTLGMLLIDNAQGKTNGTLFITGATGNTSTGSSREITVKAGDSIRKLLQTLSDREPSYDWDIIPNDTLGYPNQFYKIWYPTRGSVRDEGLEYGPGKTVTTVTRTRNVGEFSNGLIISGGTGTSIVVKTSAGIATDPRGRWDDTRNYNSVSIQDTLQKHADRDIIDSVDLSGSYNVKLRRGWWRGPSHLWIGDTVTLKIVRGRVNETTTMRIYEVDVTLDDDGGEEVRLVLVKT